MILYSGIFILEVQNIFAYFSVLLEQMKKFSIYILATFFLFPLVGFSQQEPQISQNMYNILPVNPGVAGTSGAICANLLYRNQWTGFVGAPKTGLLNIDAPIKFLKGGVGLTVFSDELGLDKTFGAKLDYSFHLNIGPGKLGIGIQGGFLNKKLEASKFNPFVSDGTDETIPTSDVSSGATTFGFGLFYSTDVYYFGISSTQLAESSVKYSGFVYNLKRHYYLTAGLAKRLTPTLELVPSLWFKYDPPVAPQIDLNVLVRYNNQFWGGVSYRVMDVDAIIPMIGLMWNDVKIGYAYDMTLSKIRGFSSGSHEIMLGYCFKMSEKISAQRYRNVRFL